MADGLKDAFKMGLGALDLAHEEAEQVVAKFQEQHAAEIKEGRQMLDAALKKAKKDTSAAQVKVRAAVRDAVQKQELVHEKDLQELCVTVERLGTVAHKIASDAAKNAAAQVKKAAKKAPKPAKKSAKRAKASARKPAKKKKR
jgi:polyhydroxyalkanoate synthesis regulator phasin